MARIKFSDEKSNPKPAVIASFDLCGFSDFCNRDDASVMLPRFLARLFSEANDNLMGGVGAALENLDEFLGGTAERKKVVTPEYMKFTGDGALMIWLAGWDEKFGPKFCTAVVRVMRNLQQRIAGCAPEWEKEWRVTGVPSRARFGITTGLVYPLVHPETQWADTEYVGYSVNLAVRLQNHCPKVGFLVHESLHPQLDGLVKLEALGMKGSRNERVLAFDEDLVGIEPDYFRTKFRLRT